MVAITYPNGVRQILTEIPQKDFQDIKELEAAIATLEENKKENEAEIARIKLLLSAFDMPRKMLKAGTAYTSESPIGEAVRNNGKLVLPETQGGTMYCKIEQL